ncbi:MAG TPA: PLDc N-terminal domain-containing protein [Candidatus Eremiobacteraeota bacterium]|nr:MAG: hypothetical protein BWY64_00085 [bacterium ADurb.Bin363]HPZ06507.1 PLDc N-terminal domain-containing protein [Candidatus Eremiobacteraeota bacterium]
MFAFEYITTIIGIIFLSLAIWMILWIYRDARKRNMMAFLWAYIAILLPVISWIIYLFVRNPTPSVQCPDCFEKTSRDDVLCRGCSYNFIRIARKRGVKIRF